MTATDRFDVPDHSIHTLHKAQEIAIAAHSLGLLDSQESDAVNSHVERAELAQHAALQAKDALAAERHRIAIDVADGKTKPSEIAAESLKLADLTNVYRIAEIAYAESAKRAYRAALVNGDRAVEVINEHLAHLAERAAELAPLLANITTADQALKAGRGDAWLEVSDLKSTHSSLRTTAYSLREAGALPQPRIGGFGDHWQYRTDPKLTEIGKNIDWASKAESDLPDQGRHRFLARMSAGPYTPASEQEAESVRRDHEAAQDEAQAKLYGIAR